MTDQKWSKSKKEGYSDHWILDHHFKNAYKRSFKKMLKNDIVRTYSEKLISNLRFKEKRANFLIQLKIKINPAKTATDLLEDI